MAGTDKAAELYAFVKEYAQLKLEAETKRYESLIQQASNMPGRRQPIYLTFRFCIDLCFC